jgi:hypothetical protein
MSPWIPVIATLIAGGTMGAIVTVIVAYRRSQLQPVGYLTLTVPFLRTDFVRLPEEFRIFLQESTNLDSFVFAVAVQLTNLGNQDYPQFTFGITFNSQCSILTVACATSDRHHVITYKPTLEELDSSPTSRMDFTLEPFNREDTYFIHLIIVTSDWPKLDEPRMSTNQPVRLVETLGHKARRMKWQTLDKPER